MVKKIVSTLESSPLWWNLGIGPPHVMTYEMSRKCFYGARLPSPLNSKAVIYGANSITVKY